MLYLLRSFGKEGKSALKLGYASDIDRRCSMLFIISGHYFKEDIRGHIQEVHIVRECTIDKTSFKRLLDVGIQSDTISHLLFSSTIERETGVKDPSVGIDKWVCLEEEFQKFRDESYFLFPF